MTVGDLSNGGRTTPMTSSKQLEPRQLIDRVSGGLYGGIIGDAMGAATEMLTPRQIQERYGWVDRLLAPEKGTFAAGRNAGMVTDDSGITLAIVEQLIASGGQLTPEDSARALLAWADDAECFSRFAGPSTKRAIEALRSGATPEAAGAPSPMDNDLRVSNGAAMKAAPAGYANIGRPEEAVHAAAAICIPTHNTDIAFSGAGAIAAAVAVACSAAASLEEVIDASIWGAECGLQIGGTRAHEVPGPSIAARIELAVELAHRENDRRANIELLGRTIGAGIAVAEAVPLAIGLVSACKGDPAATIEAAVNLGDDSDTTATIAGCVAGSFAGASSIALELREGVSSANNLDVASLARSLVEFQFATTGRQAGDDRG
jgi:ADP-ribosylglycohydrolase